jgi:hypothetical protein
MRAPEPIGKCIYCGVTGVRLNDEHIIPYGLDGNRVLAKASCVPCAEITSKIERHCQQEMLGLFRRGAGLRSRRKQPDKVPLNVTYPDGRTRTLKVGAKKVPRLIALPVFPIARALRGLGPDLDDVALSGASWWSSRDQEAIDNLGAKYGFVTMDGGVVDPLLWARMIAKIAHGAAVEKYGVDGFEHLAPNFILGKTSWMNYIVGCMGAETIETTDLHSIGFRVHRESGMIIVQVRLFANFGAPTYHVLVGLMPGGRITKVFSSSAGGEPMSYPVQKAPQTGPVRVTDLGRREPRF